MKSIARINSVKSIPGYLPGMPQATSLVEITISSVTVNRQHLERFEQSIAKLIGRPCDIDCALNVETPQALSSLASAAMNLLKHAGMPVFGQVLVVRAPNMSDSSIQLAFPAINGDHGSTQLALGVAVRLLDQIIAEQPLDGVWGTIQTALRKIRSGAPKGINTLRFLQAARDAGIPWRRVHGNVFQFGWGAKARWLDSSFTDRTPNIAAAIARNKFASAAVLRDAGIPVPRHFIARNEEQAVAIAEKLGYPAVVKPADLDGGKGVMAGLKNSQSVREAYAKASALSKFVLVEEHFEGRDYRLQVYNGEVYWAVERVPGGVIGDGFASIGQLLDKLNAERKPGGKDHILKRIHLDDEANGLLNEEGLSPDSIPENGRFVRLRRSANVANGGTPIPSLQQAHPDNLALAARAARALRLDVAGIDLLIPDIGVSWLQCRAAICEVNAQPQLAAHLPSYLLSHLVQDQGRIPFAIVLGRLTDHPWLESLKRVLTEEGRCLGVAAIEGVWIGKERLSAVALDSYRGGLALVADPKTDAGLIVIENERHYAGLPVDRFDALILAGPPTNEQSQSARPSWERLVPLLAAMCPLVLVNRDCPGCAAIGARLKMPSVKQLPQAELAEALRHQLNKTRRYANR